MLCGQEGLSGQTYVALGNALDRVDDDCTKVSVHGLVIRVSSISKPQPSRSCLVEEAFWCSLLSCCSWMMETPILALRRLGREDRVQTGKVDCDFLCACARVSPDCDCVFRSAALVGVESTKVVRCVLVDKAPYLSAPVSVGRAPSRVVALWFPPLLTMNGIGVSQNQVDEQVVSNPKAEERYLGCDDGPKLCV